MLESKWSNQIAKIAWKRTKEKQNSKTWNRTFIRENNATCSHYFSSAASLYELSKVHYWYTWILLVNSSLPSLQCACLHFFKNRFSLLLVDFPKVDCVLFPIITNTDDTALKINNGRLVRLKGRHMLPCNSADNWNTFCPGMEDMLCMQSVNFCKYIIFWQSTQCHVFKNQPLTFVTSPGKGPCWSLTS